ncbi:hypothetical protein KCU78_g388, partial [Aureobasidium melanogenum]
MSEAHAGRIGNMAAPAIGTTPTNITAAATTAAATAAPGERPGPGANPSPYSSRKDSAAASRKASSTTNIPLSNTKTGVTTPSANNTCNNVAGNSVNSRMNSDPATNDCDIMGTPATTILGQAHEAVPSTHNASDTRHLPNTVSANIYSDSGSIAVQDWESTLSPNTASRARGFSVSSSTGRASAAATELFFSGDTHGYGYVLDICNDGSVPSTQHHFIPRTAAPNMDKASMEYAEAKDCFAVIDPAICEEFIYAYFRYVHPMLPIIDIGDFLDRHWGVSTEPIIQLQPQCGLKDR